MRHALRPLLVSLGLCGALPASLAVASPPPIDLAAAEGAVLSPMADDTPAGATHRVALSLALSEDLSSHWIVDVNPSDGWTIVAGKQRELDAPALSGLHVASTAVDLVQTSRTTGWLVLQVGAFDLEHRKDPQNWRLYFRSTDKGLQRVGREVYYAEALGLVDGAPAVVTGGSIEFPMGTASTPPWENPALPADSRRPGGLRAFLFAARVVGRRDR